MPSPFKGIALALLVVGVVLAWSGRAEAAQTASSDLVIISEGETIDDDLYAAGLKVTIEGVVDGDLVAFAAEEVVISGEVTGSVLAVAPTVTVSGTVGGALRVSSSSLSVDGSVGRDLVAGVVEVGLGSSSEVVGDVVIWSFTTRAKGTTGGDFRANARRLELEGSVGGDVDVTANRVSITGPLTVGGDLDYRSPQPADGIDQATVDGTVVHKSPLPPNIRVRALTLLTRFLVVLVLTAAALLVAWGWPDRTERAAQEGRARPFAAFWRGALIVFSPLMIAALAGLVVALAPAAASLPLLVIFVPLVLVTAALVVVLSLVAGAPAALALGRLLPGRREVYGAIVVGSLVAGVAWLVPLVGWLVPLILLPFGLGCWLLPSRSSQQT